MWTGHHKVRVSVYGDADADPDLAVRLEVALGGLLQAGAVHLVVHLEITPIACVPCRLGGRVGRARRRLTALEVQLP
jgi:hypothetical protein